jgi:hypothetical protein
VGQAGLACGLLLAKEVERLLELLLADLVFGLRADALPALANEQVVHHQVHVVEIEYL